ncbi:MAG: hypothetical protein HY303_19645 [Candidatus Wallbacteria bacterium]|nr:hypothetical protein [Candidatus Wallbacteria bacterium]
MSIRSYQVGFGDCFLLSFGYGNAAKPTSERHVLIDFGTTKLPRGADKDQMVLIAQDIAKRCGGKLHGLVATHRHRDHISGFATTKGSESSGSIIASLNPDVVVQPWTGDPKAASNALAPTTTDASTHKGFVGSLTRMQAVSRLAVGEAARIEGWAGVRLLSQIKFLGEDNVKNPEAVRNLLEMGKKAQHQVFASYGVDSQLGSVLPGVQVDVLGPPTLLQSKAIKKERQKDANEYWHLVEGALATTAGPGPRASETAQPLPDYTHWFIPRVRAIRASQLLEIVQSLDGVLNNTSLILLFQVGKTKLLFPGDAQIENWSYCLFEAPDSETRKRQLEDVALYKVGHHGSLNATPKTLWNGFANRGAAKSPKRLKSLLSTLPGKHGSKQKDSEVPRGKLLDELKAQSDLTSTDDLTPKKILHCEDVLLKLA